MDRHFSTDAVAREKDEAAIQAGKYEIQNREFYRENTYRQVGATAVQPDMVMEQGPTTGTGTITVCSSDMDNGERQSRLGKWGKYFDLGSQSSSSSSTTAQGEPVRPTAKLRKRSTSRMSGSKLSVVGE